MAYKKKNTPIDDGGIDVSGLCVPERLKALRLEYELTQTDVANVLNMSTREYWRLEQKNYCTRYINLLILSVFYNVSMDYLFGLTNEKNNIYDSEHYNGSYSIAGLQWLNLSIPNVEEYKRQKAEAEQ